MKISLKVLLPIILAALTIFIAIKYDNAIMLVISTLVLSIVQIAEFRLLKKQIREKEVIVIGKSRTYRSTKTMEVIGGLLIIIWGILATPHVTFEFYGINGFMCIGFFFFISGITTYNNYSILLKTSTLVYNDVVNHPEIKYEKLDSFTIGSDTIKFRRKSREFTFEMTEIDKENALKITDFLKGKIGNKLVIVS